MCFQPSILNQVSPMSDHNPESLDSADRITALQAALEESERARRGLEASAIARSSFLASMDAALRTPLTSIMGFADLLADPGCDPKAREEAVGTIRRSAGQLLTVINDILDLARPDEATQVVEEADLGPADLVHRAVALCAVSGASPVVDVDEDVPRLIRSDPVRLMRILSDALDAAVGASRTGQVLVRVSCASGPGNAPLIRFRITAPSAPPSELSGHHRIIEAARLASLLGGAVDIAGGPAIGSIADITVPASPASSPEPAATQRAPIEDARADRHRVLIVEDGQDNARLLRFHMQRQGFEVCLAEDGQAALDILADENASGRGFSIVLLDMEMPVMDGYETARQLRTRRFRGRIIALTAHVQSGDREACLIAGCDDYLSKPFTSESLAAAVRRHMPTTAPVPGHG
jgi:CheY-like chemotaxis protein